MTCTNLDQLPSEIINLINSHLDLGSIQSLRRTTATISAKCHGHSWLRFFHTQETDLTAPSLARLSDIAAHKHLRTAIGNITVIAGINDANGNKESEEENNQSAQRQILKQQDASRQTSLDGLVRAFRLLGTIGTIKLTARLIRGPGDISSPSSNAPPWRLTWRSMSEIFYTTTSAMAVSQIRTQTLDCFLETPPSYGIQSIDVARHFPSLQSQGFSGDSITTFAISWTPCASAIEEAKLEGVRFLVAMHKNPNNPSAGLSRSLEEFRSDDNFTGIARLLNTMPNLTTLSLYMHEGVDGLGSPQKRTFREIADSVKFPSLQRLHLRGIFATQTSLVQLFQSHRDSLVEIDLQEVRIDASESWNVVLSHLQEMPHVDILHVSAIRTGAHLANLMSRQEGDREAFSVAGLQRSDALMQTWYPCLGGPLLHTRSYTKEQIRDGLEVWEEAMGSAMQSPAHARWSRNRQVLFREL